MSNHLHTREGVVALLEDATIPAASCDVFDVTARLKETRPRVLVVDLGIGKHAASSILNESAVQSPSVHRILLGSFPHQSNIGFSAARGIAAFVLKTASGSSLLAAIRSMLEQP